MMNKQVGLLVLLGFVMAAPSIIGTNGLINMPAATSVKYKEFDVGLNWELLQQTTATGASHRLHYLANLGIFDGVELGLSGTNDKEGAFINLKYYMLSDQSQYPLGLAVGVTNVASHSQTDLYMVLSKLFPNNLGGHLGFKSNLLAGKIRADVMLGLEMFMSDNMTLLGDMIGSENSWSMAVGARLKLAPDMLLNVYLQDIAGKTIDKATFSIGTSWHSSFQ